MCLGIALSILTESLMGWHSKAVQECWAVNSYILRLGVCFGLVFFGSSALVDMNNNFGYFFSRHRPRSQYISRL